MLQKLLFALEVHFIMEDDKRPQTWHFMLSKSIKIIPGHLIRYPPDINQAKVGPRTYSTQLMSTITLNRHPNPYLPTYLHT